MRVLALAYFDPASVVLSHRNLMRSAGHDFRLAVVRAYTGKQREADWVLEQMIDESPPNAARGYWVRRLEKLDLDLNSLREFAQSADVIQFHPGIGHGDGDWASREGTIPYGPQEEAYKIAACFGWTAQFMEDIFAEEVHFIHGSRATWSNLPLYQEIYRGYEYEGAPVRLASSTIDYATELDAAYLPPFVDVGDLRAPLRGDDDPLLVAHTPTDRVACSTEEFLKATRGLGIPVRLGEGLKHKEILQLKAECNAGFDHLRGAFSVNTLENAALGLAPLFKLADKYRDRFDAECHDIYIESLGYNRIAQSGGLRDAIRALDADPCWMRGQQRNARSWWETYFSAEPITKRLVKFYEGL